MPFDDDDFNKYLDDLLVEYAIGEIEPPLEEVKLKPFVAPTFHIPEQVKGNVITRLHVANADASKCYIQVLLPVVFHYTPTEKGSAIMQESNYWQTMVGPVDYDEAVAVYRMVVLGEDPDETIH